MEIHSQLTKTAVLAGGVEEAVKIWTAWKKEINEYKAEERDMKLEWGMGDLER